MTRVRTNNFFVSLDGFTASGQSGDNPMGEDWERLIAAYSATRTMREHIFGDTTGGGTTGLDETHAAAHFVGIGAEIMGAGMFGLHAYPDDPAWRGWWGEEPPFSHAVFVLTHTAPRPPLPVGATTFHFRNAPVEDILAEAKEAAGDLDVRVSGGASTVRSFVRAGLVDVLHVGIVPVLLGRGHRFWDDLAGLDLTHDVSSEVATESGTLHVTFTRKEQA